MIKAKIDKAIKHTRERKKKLTGFFGKCFREKRDLNGVTVIELVLILVIICTCI